MTDICVNHHRGNPESFEADIQVEPFKKLVRVQIEALLVMAGPRGLTSEEVESALSLSHQTASARLAELKARGLAVPGERRVTMSGCWARAVVHSDYAASDNG